jgi:hypothetical protein
MESHGPIGAIEPDDLSDPEATSTTGLVAYLRAPGEHPDATPVGRVALEPRTEYPPLPGLASRGSA